MEFAEAQRLRWSSITTKLLKTLYVSRCRCTKAERKITCHDAGSARTKLELLKAKMLIRAGSRNFSSFSNLDFRKTWSLVVVLRPLLAHVLSYDGIDENWFWCICTFRHIQECANCTLFCGGSLFSEFKKVKVSNNELQRVYWKICRFKCAFS